MTRFLRGVSDFGKPERGDMRPLTLGTVLVATDLSDDDLPALRSAIELSRLAGARLHVVHAVPDADTDLAAQLEEHFRSADPSATALPGMTLRAGPANHVIVDVATMIDAAVIVLGPHRPGRSRSPGGTAYQVAAIAERPCLVLPGAMHLPLGRILVPVDASGAARGALAVGMTWASALRRRTAHASADSTEVVVLHVQGPDEEAASAQALMGELLSAVEVIDYAGVGVRQVAERGADASAVILEHGATEDCDLIVLGTRADNQSSDGLGSVSSAVVRSTALPVLLVPPRVWHEYDDAAVS
jgi:nucleotide-binding universal stress UspA family protein